MADDTLPSAAPASEEIVIGKRPLWQRVLKWIGIALLLHPLRDLQNVPQPLIIDDSALVDLGQLIEDAIGQRSVAALQSAGVGAHAPAWRRDRTWPGWPRLRRQN